MVEWDFRDKKVFYSSFQSWLMPPMIIKVIMEGLWQQIYDEFTCGSSFLLWYTTVEMEVPSPTPELKAHKWDYRLQQSSQTLLHHSAAVLTSSKLRYWTYKLTAIVCGCMYNATLWSETGTRRATTSLSNIVTELEPHRRVESDENWTVYRRCHRCTRLSTNAADSSATVHSKKINRVCCWYTEPEVNKRK